MGPGDSVTTEDSDHGISLSPGPAGADQNWDFTGIATSNETTGFFVDPATAPGGGDYPTANVCQEIPVDATTFMYFFYRRDMSGVTMLGGSYFVEPSTTILMAIDSTGPMFINPISYGSQWTVTMTYYAMTGGINHVEVRNYHADAWGTVTDIFGTYECLRVQRHRVRTQYDDGLPGDVTEEYSYDWMTPGMGIVCSMYPSEPGLGPDFSTGEFDRTSYGQTAVAASSWSAIKAIY